MMAYREAQRDADLARLRRLLVLRAMVATGMRQRQIADELGISQPAVSQQLRRLQRSDCCYSRRCAGWS